MNYIIIGLFFIILISGIIKDRSKILAVLIMIILFIITCFSHDEYDYLLYERLYLSAANGIVLGYELFYTFLMKIGNMLGLNYDGFRMVLNIIEILLIHATVKRYNKNSDAYVWALFLIFPGWIISTLTRHFLALSIIVYSLRFIIEDKNKVRETIYYFICVILASLIHSSFWIFVVMILVKYFDHKKILKYALIFALVVHAFGYTNFLFDIYSLLPIRTYTIEKYMSNNYANAFGTIYQFLRQSIIIFWGIYSVKIYNKYRTKQDIDTLSDVFMSRVQAINYASIFFIGIMYYSGNANRLNHVVILINCIASGICISNINWRTLQRLIPKVISLTIVLLLSILAGTVESEVLFERVLLMIFRTNTFINF